MVSNDPSKPAPAKRSQRVKDKANAYKAEHGVSYQEALRAVTAAPALTPPASTAEIPSFLEALGITDLASHDFAEAWAWARLADEEFLGAPYAYRRDGNALLGLDLINFVEEPRGGDGPHTIIAGRTGSGKSFLLHGLITALAALYGPDRVTFALASAKLGISFDSFTSLPHTVANARDLDNNPELCEQFLSAMRSEARRREELITRNRCKDIVEYQVRQREHHSDPAWPDLPQVIMILDDFYELLIENTGRLDYLLEIGRIGRSLGMHLLFVEQHAGILRLGELGQHLTARIALPLTSPADSRALIGTDDASLLQGRPFYGFRKFHGTGPIPIVALDWSEPVPGDVTPDGADPMTQGDAVIARLANISVRSPQSAWSPEAVAHREAEERQKLVDGALAQIDDLIGLDSTKAQLRQILNTAGVAAELRRRGRDVPGGPRNIVLAGPPGTGKNTIAHVLLEVLHAAGITRSTDLTSVTRTDLVGQFEGETGRKSAEAFYKARGGVLLLDEAPNLLRGRDSGKSDPFGVEAVNALAADMSRPGDNSVRILTGYPDEMDRFLSAVPEIVSSIDLIIKVDRPTPLQLWKYLLRFAGERRLVVDVDAKEVFTRELSALTPAKRDLAGNIRFARNVIEQASRIAAQRLSGLTVEQLADVPDAELFAISVDDIVAAIEQVLAQLPQ